MTAIQRDYYKVLQVDPEASPEVITAAYKTLAKRFHPETDLTGVHEIRLAELTVPTGCCATRPRASAMTWNERIACTRSDPGPEREPVLMPAVVAAGPAPHQRRRHARRRRHAGPELPRAAGRRR